MRAWPPLARNQMLELQLYPVLHWFLQWQWHMFLDLETLCTFWLIWFIYLSNCRVLQYFCFPWPMWQVRRIISILNQWTTSKDSAVENNMEGKLLADNDNINRLLDCCHKYLSKLCFSIFICQSYLLQCFKWYKQLVFHSLLICSSQS